MTIKTTYIAFDDKEFESEQACRNYEAEAMERVEEIREAYSLLDKDMNQYNLRQDSIEHFLSDLEDISDICEYIHVKELPSRAVHKFIYQQIGCILPEKEIGFYRYNWNNDEWVKMD